MQMSHFIRPLRHCLSQWFRKRNIIIVSDNKVHHVPISVNTQLGLLALTVSGICWLSYSTGSFIAARSALKEQSQTLRDVASARVDSNFSTVFAQNSLSNPVKTDSDVQALPVSLTDPMFTLTALDHNKLFARISFLEQKVSELQTTNESIIQRVRDKTAGGIDDLESIIKRTGLNPQRLKKQAQEKAARTKTDNDDSIEGQGGPFIPAFPGDGAQEELFSNLDELILLRDIVGTLPLGMPIRNAENHSNFGRRIDPFTGRLAFHSGLDLSGPAGSRIHSTGDGKVVAAERNGAYGNMVDIDHGFGVVTRYGHLSEILVREGDRIKKDQVIGIEGSTGRSTGPHLHYEVRYYDQAMNPENFISAGKYVLQK